MPQKSLRIALVGAAGKVAAHCHLNALPMVERAELVALCDLDSKRLEQLGAKHAVPKLYRDYQQVLEDSQIDAVDLAVPPFLHAPMTIAAANAGKHVYVEKPMGRSVGEAKSMIAAAEAAGCTLMVGESYFYHGPQTLAHDLIAAGEIGQVVQVQMTQGPWIFAEAENQRLEGRGHGAPWRQDGELTGGGEFPWMGEYAPHLFATARRYVQKRHIEKVNAMTRQRRPGCDGHTATVAGGSGSRWITSIGWVFEGGDTDGIWNYLETPPQAVRWLGCRSEIVGTRGTIRVFGEAGGAAPGFSQVAPITLYRDGTETHYDPNEGSDRSWQSNNSYYDHAHANTLRNFVESVLDGTPLRYDVQDGLHDLKATLATIMSAMEQRAVALSEVNDEWTAYGSSDQ